jgi:DNA-binding NarL/FixJ family response regulator
VKRLTHRLASREPSPSSSLTTRELEVLNLLVTGITQPEIARRLYITPKTVGKHIEHILAKLGVHSRAQAVAYAILHKLV